MTNHDWSEQRGRLAQVRTNVTDAGRVNQKLRTRQALVAAATELVSSGVSPTLAEVAEHARVSKTTAYRYFASVEALIEEVGFNRDFPTVDEVLTEAGDDPTTRVLAVEEAITTALLAHEREMRVIVRNAIEMSLTMPDHGPLRVGRRRTLIAAALEPLEAELGPAVLQQLRDALALVIGPEAIIAARDICRLSPDETRSVTRWATEALMAHARQMT